MENNWSWVWLLNPTDPRDQVQMFCGLITSAISPHFVGVCMRVECIWGSDLIVIRGDYLGSRSRLLPLIRGAPRPKIGPNCLGMHSYAPLVLHRTSSPVKKCRGRQSP